MNRIPQFSRQTVAAPQRSEYLVDHCRVSFHDDSAWHCECRQFSTAGVCRHTREAESMRIAQAEISAQLRRGASSLRVYPPRSR